MLIPVNELLEDFNVKPTSILHVGAHLAEESLEYEKNFNVPVLWIEAQSKLCSELRRILNPKMNTVIEACVFDKNDELLTLNISSNSQSTSILHFGTHAVTYPDIFVSEGVVVRTKRLDKILEGRKVPDFVNLDIQGVELRALKSLGDLLTEVNVVYTEVNKRYVYEGCDLIKDIDDYLGGYGFRRIATRWVFRAGWGDALYISSNIEPRSFRQLVRSKFRSFKHTVYSSKNIIRRVKLVSSLIK
jgi:FkbM family methyltransferase